MRLIGRGIVIGLCAVACVVALSLHTERVAAAGYIVATPSGSGPGSLLDAIRQVNAGAGTGDTITITATGTITPDIALPEILNPVAITGPGAAMLTVSGGNAVQVFVVHTGVTVSIANLTIANGQGGSSAGQEGGGIRNSGTLTVTNTTIASNSVLSDGGGIFNAAGGTLTVTNTTLSSNTATGVFGDGGGIFNKGTLTVTNTTLSSNSATDGSNGGGIENDGGTMNLINSTLSVNTAGYGGGIYINSGTVTVTNSTLSGNSAVLFSASGGYGGGIENGNGTLTLTNSTLTGNSASSYDGGGIETFGTSNLTNTIVAGNTAARNGPDINGTVVSHGHNLIGNTTGGNGFIASDKQNVNPLLSPLADNGGTTPLPDGSHVKTQAITSTSPAFHAGDPTTCTAPFPTGANSQDERGPAFPRSTTACSIGAFEPQSAAVTITLSPTTLPAATGGAPYSQTLTATGGTAPYTFTVTTGTLPTGLSLSTGGLLSGTPTAGGTFSFTIQAKDANGFTGSQAYTLTVTAPTITLSPTTLPGGVKGIAYPATTLTAAGGTAPYTVTVTTGTLPAGLTLSPSGVLSGTPTAGGAFTFTVTATDANRFTGMQQYTITVSTTAPPMLKSITLTGPGGTPPPATLKVGQNVAITATGTYSDGSTQNLSTQVQWSSSNAQVAMVDTTGKVTGESPGTVTITATLNGVSQTFTVTVVPPTPIGITVAPAPASRPSGVSIASPGSSAPAAAPVGR